jgi:hypothetical protein
MSAFSANIGTPPDFYKYPHTTDQKRVVHSADFLKGPFGRLAARAKGKQNDKNDLFCLQRKIWHKIWI